MDIIPEKPAEHLAQAFFSCSHSFVSGLIRILSGQAVFYRSSYAISKLRTPSSPTETPAERIAEALKALDGINHEKFDAHRYLTLASHLVYATTLLDTFLSDVTTFLYLSYPQALGEDRKLEFKEVLQARSREEIIMGVARIRVRSLSYKPFLARLEALRITFGLSIDLDETTTRILTHYSSIRNAFVHDQAIFEFGLDAKGAVTAKKKTCPLHPTRITDDDVDVALSAYKVVVCKVCEAVYSGVLKTEMPPPVADLLINRINETATGQSEA